MSKPRPTPRSAAPARRRILVVDDHPMMREGLGQLLGGQADLELCASAEDAAGALRVVEHAALDLVLVDISLRESNGLELIKDLRLRRPRLPVLVLSMHDETLYAERVLRAGAQGYVMKSESGDVILAAIRQVLAGRIHLSDAMSTRLLGHLAGHKSAGAPASSVEQLSDRELEVFTLLGQGRTTREMAQALRVSVKTVEAHRANIKQKLGIVTAPELIRHAVHWVENQERA
jgi:DNA-binding NarL/FixJ family response regulator